MTKRVTSVGLVGLAILAVLACAAVFLSSRENKKIRQDNTGSIEQQTYETDLSRQIQTAESYETESYMWANTILNAAIYAADHNMCQQADDLFTEARDEPSTTKHGFDLKSIEERVYADCQT